MLMILKCCQSLKEIRKLKKLSATRFCCCICVSEHISSANCCSELGNTYLCGRAVLSQD